MIRGQDISNRLYIRVIVVDASQLSFQFGCHDVEAFVHEKIVAIGLDLEELRLRRWLEYQRNDAQHLSKMKKCLLEEIGYK